MKKLLALSLAIALCVGMGAPAMAEGITLRTVSIFAGTDPAAGTYLELIRDWEAETGNRVDDASAVSDEAWKAGVLNDFAVGNEPDVLFYFASSADSAPILDKVVPISEINAAYPELRLTENLLLMEPDGYVYAVPVRSFWEGLFCNTDLFEEYDLDLPTDWEKMVNAVETFRANGIVPISLSMSDIPHYIVEFSILACGSPQDHQALPKGVQQLPKSWIDGMSLINTLYEMGAFAPDVNATTDELSKQMFYGKRAAMRVDGSWFANGVAQDHWDTTSVIPFPAYSEEADPTAIIGGVSMGFYITCKTWNDPARREAAVSFLAKMTGEEGVSKLGFFFGGELLKDAKEMVSNARYLCGPIQDLMDQEARNYWFSMVPSIADGSADAQQVMKATIERGAF